MSIDRPGPATLGDLADRGMDVWAWCNGCFKNGAVATGARVRCCRGGRDIETRPNWPDNLGAVTQHTDAGACA